MAGVEILAIEELIVNTIFNWKVFWIWFGIAFIIFIITALFIGDFIVASIVLAVGIIFGFAAAEDKRIPIEYQTQYKVIISDEVPMSDFIEKYKIIEQEGRIFTVIEID